MSKPKTSVSNDAANDLLIFSDMLVDEDASLNAQDLPSDWTFSWNINRIHAFPFPSTSPSGVDHSDCDVKVLTDKCLHHLAYLVHQHTTQDIKDICLRFTHGNPVSGLSFFTANIASFVNILHQVDILNDFFDAATKANDPDIEQVIPVKFEIARALVRYGSSLMGSAELILSSERFSIVTDEPVLLENDGFKRRRFDVDTVPLKTLLKAQAEVGYNMLCAGISLISIRALLRQVRRIHSHLLKREGFVEITGSSLSSPSDLKCVHNKFRVSKERDYNAMVVSYSQHLYQSLDLIEDTAHDAMSYAHAGATVNAYVCLFNIGSYFLAIFNEFFCLGLKKMTQPDSPEQQNASKQLRVSAMCFEELKACVEDLLSKKTAFPPRCYEPLRGTRLQENPPVLSKCLEDLKVLLSTAIELCCGQRSISTATLHEELNKYLSILGRITELDHEHVTLINVVYVSDDREYHLYDSQN